ncbi:MAG: hypothetical protein HQK94_16695 [Nitrospirae bacterium]|nr:hypothetical protein [Nitrospirota bacterium]
MENLVAEKLVTVYNESIDYHYKYLDEAILWLCGKYPDHTTEEKVYGKIALINNAYRANLLIKNHFLASFLLIHAIKIPR